MFSHFTLQALVVATLLQNYRVLREADTGAAHNSCLVSLTIGGIVLRQAVRISNIAAFIFHFPFFFSLSLSISADGQPSFCRVCLAEHPEINK